MCGVDDRRKTKKKLETAKITPQVLPTYNMNSQIILKTYVFPKKRPSLDPTL